MTRLFNQVLWLGRQYLKAVGLWGALSCGLILFTSVFLYLNLVSISRLHSDVQPSSLLIDAPSSNLNQTPHVLPSKEVDNNIDTLRSMASLLPKELSLPSILKQMHQQAKLAKLTIASADYKWRKLKKTSTLTDGNLVQYEITFSVTGDYFSIRNMVNMIMTKIPTLALDGFEFERESASSPFVEARVTFVIFLLGQPE